ncbi:MAG: Calx-beta domain-containing protein [Thermoanaerobaculia bacterium]|nr:Calx-beta domain-containing protein [Thermoanaerobaculia bacterium]
MIRRFVELLEVVGVRSRHTFIVGGSILLFGLFGVAAGAQEPGTYRLVFSPPDPVVSEDAGQLELEVSIEECSEPRNAVVWRTSAEGGSSPSAAPGEDFGTVTPPEITLGEGSPTGTVTLPILQDESPEGMEEVILRLDTEGGGVLGCEEGARRPEEGGTEVRILIEDDEVSPGDLPEVSVGHARVVEGDSGIRQMEFSLRLSVPGDEEVRVRVGTVEGTATADEDFRPIERTVRIPRGEDAETVRVAVLGDGIEEENETFSLELAEPENAVLGTATGQGLIEDDDSARSVSLEIVGSDGRRASPGEIVVLQVRMLTESGSPAPEAEVQWRMSSDTDGELLDGPVTLTDDAGIASQRVATGENAGVSSVVARDAGGTREVFFTVTVGETFRP